MIPDVFGPARLGPVALRNRVVKAATFEGRTPAGQVTDDLIDYHLAVARGGVGLTTVAYLAVAPEGRTHAEQIVVGQHSLAGLSRMAEAIHETGAKIAGQVGHAGPVANGRSNRATAISASRMPSPLSMQMVHAATEEDLTRVTAAYVDAARTLVRAGFDVLELHMAHSYLHLVVPRPRPQPAPRSLGRTRWRTGPAWPARSPAPSATRSAARPRSPPRSAWTTGSAAGCAARRRSTSPGCSRPTGTLDALQLSGGSSLMNPMYLFRGDAPRREFAAVMPQPVRLGMRLLGKRFLKEYPFQEAYFREPALRFRQALAMPLMLLGGINRLETMEQAMAEGFEYVALARALLREPDLVDRLRSGRQVAGACIHCNLCMPTIYDRTRCPVTTPA